MAGAWVETLRQEPPNFCESNSIVWDHILVYTMVAHTKTSFLYLWTKKKQKGNFVGNVRRLYREMSTLQFLRRKEMSPLIQWFTLIQLMQWKHLLPELMNLIMSKYVWSPTYPRNEWRVERLTNLTELMCEISHLSFYFILL